MNAHSIFRQRLFENIRFQVKTLRLVFDWTVIVYMLIPALIIGSFMYASAFSTLPNWIDVLPMGFILFIVYALTWTSSIRLFSEEADQLFLLQRQALYKSLKRIGLIYSSIMASVTAVGPILIFMPYFYDRDLTNTSLFLFMILIAALKITITLFRQYLFLTIPRRWLRLLIQFAIFIIGAILYVKNARFLFEDLFSSSIMIMFLLGLSFIISQSIIHTRSSFADDIVREQEAKYRFASLLLMQAGVDERRVTKPRRRPWLFRKSNHLFKQRNANTIILEIYLKAWLRKRQNIFNYIRFLMIAIVVLVLFPTSWHVFITIGLMLLFYQMNRIEWQTFAQSAFYRLVIRDPKDFRHVLIASRALLIVSLPGFVFFSFIAGMFAFGMVGALAYSAFVIVLSLISWFRQQTMSD